MEARLEYLIWSAITVIEIFQGMGNKTELAQMKKKIKFYDVVQIDEAISQKANDNKKHFYILYF